MLATANEGMIVSDISSGFAAYAHCVIEAHVRGVADTRIDLNHLPSRVQTDDVALDRLAIEAFPLRTCGEHHHPLIQIKARTGD
jgi:hypothetical protein